MTHNRPHLDITLSKQVTASLPTLLTPIFLTTIPALAAQTAHTPHPSSSCTLTIDIFLYFCWHEGSNAIHLSAKGIHWTPQENTHEECIIFANAPSQTQPTLQVRRSMDNGNFVWQAWSIVHARTQSMIIILPFPKLCQKKILIIIEKQ